MGFLLMVEMIIITNIKKCLSVVKVLLLLPRRIGRVVDCGSLENYCTERYRGFESLILRQKLKVSVLRPFFMKKMNASLPTEVKVDFFKLLQFKAL